MTTATKSIGLLHPGEMGASVGASLIASGNPVYWVSEGRSEATRERAREAGLTAVDTLQDLTAQCDCLISICPPHAALEMARSIASTDFCGVYIDANAVSPASSNEIGDCLQTAGIDFIDGGIIGPPAHREGTTRLYLSGPGANAVSARFSASLLPANVVSDRIGDASALKMAYAAYTKGHSALLLNARALARHFRVEDDLLAEWALSQPALQGKCQTEIPIAAKKAWRFEAEMLEIASTMRAADLPDGFHQGAAQLYQRLGSFQHQQSPELDAVLQAALGISSE